MSKSIQPGMTRQGVPDLNNPDWKKFIRRPVLDRKNPPRFEPEPPGPFYDLLYFKDGEIEKEILAVWPEATFEPEYDFIHEWRTGVSIPLCVRFDWYRFLVQKGIAVSSFSFQMAMLQETDIIEAVLDTESPGWRERTGKQ